jgi:hypothetical protein
VRKRLVRESPTSKARLSIILQEFLTTESTKGTKMKTSENFVISVPFVVKKEHHPPNTFCHTYAICGSKQSNQPQKAQKTQK